MDLSSIPQEVLIARGEYATIRGAHEDEKKRLSVLCGQLSAISSQVLRAAQSDEAISAELSHQLDTLFLDGQKALNAMAECIEDLKELSHQRVELKQKAWR